MWDLGADVVAIFLKILEVSGLSRREAGEVLPLSGTVAASSPATPSVPGSDSAPAASSEQA